MEGEPGHVRPQPLSEGLHEMEDTTAPISLPERMRKYNKTDPAVKLMEETSKEVFTTYDTSTYPQVPRDVLRLAHDEQMLTPQASIYASTPIAISQLDTLVKGIRLHNRRSNDPNLTTPPARNDIKLDMLI